MHRLHLQRRRNHRSLLSFSHFRLYVSLVIKLPSKHTRLNKLGQTFPHPPHTPSEIPSEIPGQASRTVDTADSRREPCRPRQTTSPPIIPTLSSFLYLPVIFTALLSDILPPSWPPHIQRHRFASCATSQSAQSGTSGNGQDIEPNNSKHVEV